MARRARPRRGPAVASLGGSGGPHGGGRRRPSSPARFSRGLPVAARRAGTSRRDAIRRLGHATLPGDAAPGILHLPVPSRGAPQRGRRLRPGGRADRERAPLKRGGPGPRLSPRGEVLRAGERGLRGADGHPPGDPVRGRPGPPQREGGGPRRRGGVGGDGPRVGRAVPGVHARRGRHAPERRPRGAGGVLERRSGVSPGRLPHRARRVHPCHSCGLRIRHRAAAARARRRAGGPDRTGFRRRPAGCTGAPAGALSGRQPPARRVHPAARRRRRAGSPRSVQARDRAGTELPAGMVRPGRVLLSLRRPVRRDGRRGRGRVQPRARSGSAVLAGHRTPDLAGTPSGRSPRDRGPDSPLPRIDSTSVVAEAVGIADTLILGSAPAQLALLRTVCRHSLLALQYLAFQAAEFGTPVQRTGPARVVLRCLEQRGATDAERARLLRMGVAADLAAGWADSARLRLARATGGSAARERDQWILLARATGLPALGDWQSAAERVRGRLGVAADTEAVAHWLLARLGIERSRHAAALARLAAGKRRPLPASLATDLDARAALTRRDTTRALQLWDDATRRY